MSKDYLENVTAGGCSLALIVILVFYWMGFSFEVAFITAAVLVVLGIIGSLVFPDREDTDELS